MWRKLRVGTLVAGALLLSWSATVYGAALAYIPNWGDNTVSVIDTATNTVIATLVVGPNPEAVTVSPDQRRVYVANNGNGFGDTVSVIDTATNTVVDTFVVGPGPESLSVSPDGNTLYVATAGVHQLPPDGVNDTLTVVDLSTRTVTDVIEVGDHPWGVLAHPDGTTVYVANAHSETLSIINTATNTVIETVLLGDGGEGDEPHVKGLALSPDGSRLYMTHMHSDVLTVLDTSTNTVTDSVSFRDDACLPAGICKHLYQLAVSPDGATLYLSFFFQEEVAVVDATTLALIDVVPVGDGDPGGARGDGPKGLSLTPDGRRLYVALQFDNSVSVIDTATLTVVDEIAVGPRPVADGRFIAVTPSSSSTVGGVARGVRPDVAVCHNVSTGQSVEIQLQRTFSWNCEEQGLVVNPGDRIEQLFSGFAR